MSYPLLFPYIFPGGGGGGGGSGGIVQDPLSGGGSNDRADEIIRKHLSRAMQGPNWDALIAALSTGDDTNWRNARLAFDQLFVNTASGSWLEKRASDEGITKPINVGISDPLFRQLIIKLTSNKVVHQAIREILEIFYGVDSSRAFVETVLDEPYDLSSNPDLQWTIDEKQNFTVTFSSTEFSNSNQANAIEVAAVLTEAMQELGSDGFAISFKSPTSGKNRVRIYSGSLGLGSFVRVTGGLAQNIFNFPSLIAVYSGDTSLSGYSWSYTQPTPTTTRATLTINTGAAAPLISLNGVSDGDYVTIGSDAQIGTTGTFIVSNIKVSYSGANLIQSFDIPQIAFTGNAVQLTNKAYTFYNPIKSSIFAASGRTVLVAQPSVNEIDISIPATTQATNRGPKLAFYGRLNSGVNILRIQRVNGLVTVTTSTPHGLSLNGQVKIDNFIPNINDPFIAQGQTSVSPFAAPASFASISPLSTTTPALSTQNGRAVTITNGQVLFTGGYSVVGGVNNNEVANCNRFQITTSALIADGTEATGATQYSYQWPATASMNTARQAHAISAYTTGALVSGGFTTPFSALTAAETYAPNAWTNIASLNIARADHQQITLANGNVLVVGGRNGGGGNTIIANSELYDGVSWTAVGSLNIARFNFQLVQLSTGTLLAIGGATSNTTNAATNSVEMSTDNGTTWTKIANMTLARRGHRAVVLPNDYVLVTGGLGYNPTNNIPANAFSRTETEIFDPNASRWEITSNPGIHRQDHLMITLSSPNRIILVGGQVVGSGLNDDMTVIESFDVTSRTWNRWPFKMVSARDIPMGSVTSQGVISILGAGDGTNSYQRADILIPASDTVGGGGLNDQFQVTNIVDANNFQFSTTGFTSNYTSNTGNAYGGATDAPGGTLAIASGSRTNNITTLTLTLPSGVTNINIPIGATIFVNSYNINFGSGMKTVTNSTATTISYTEVAGAIGPTGLTNSSVSTNNAPNLIDYKVAASSQPVGDPGPYLFDPENGVAITGVTSITSGFQIFADQQYGTIQIQGVGAFPDKPGFIVLGFGLKQQAVIKYLGSYADSGSTTRLILDFNYIFKSNFPIGSDITLLSQQGPFIPTHPEQIGAAYITGSAAGRVAAENTIESILAAGVNADITIVYPGDRGLGGEGLPTHGAQKLSDIVSIFAGDEEDAEVATARTS